ncbi:putative efflux protein, MATE family [Paenibacillus sp. UNCCL117]|uniref:MATE family efflux transporter n=1 Tax=unclassified Paenibacillus TaxID=185978 RepID=UPI00088D7DA2|nr:MULTISPECIES: MATE family efflux transporter [unclassified Paenibacillus]SDD55704.1 putative efflux protein, MATE family [Paenibacillus sp. cl123]SFW51536.1 putative efflux protein, MATE family [Paenibacillus sp. UNCCL117]
MIPLRYKARWQAWLDKYFSGESIDYRQVISLFLPILIDQAFLVGLSLVNTAMISSSGVAAISAVSMVDSLNMFLVNVFVALATGGTVVVAQYKGSGNEKMVSRAAASSLSAVTLAALAISVFVLLFYHPILKLLFGTAEPEVFNYAGTYLVGSGLSYLGIAIKEAISGALRGIGRTRVTLGLSLIMNLSYVLLNVVFVHFMEMGVLGMSVAVNISRYLAAACALYYLLRMDASLRIQLKDVLAWNFSMFKKIMFIGLPFAAEQLFFNGGKIITQIYIVSLGTYAIATNAISSVLAMLLQIPAMALSTALITVVGQCVGSRNIQDARKFTKSFLWLNSAALGLTALLLLPFFKPVVGLFNPPAEIMDDLYLIMVINMAAQVVLWSISFLLPAALRAAGDSRFTSISSMLTMWLVRVVLGYVFGITLGYGVLGVWAAMQLEWGVRGTIFLWRYRGDRWYKHRLVEPASGNKTSKAL